MTITIKKPKIQDFLFWLAYGLFLVFGILSTSFYYKYFIGTPYSVIKYLCIGLLAGREVILQKYNIRSFAFGMLFIAMVLITRSQSSVSDVAYILIFLFCARNINFKEIARFSIWISSIVVIFVILSAYAGIIENYNYSSGTRTRWCLGFRYPLYAQSFLFNITGMVLYVGKDKLKWRWFVALGLINYWLYTQTNSRLSCGLSLLMIVLFAFFKLLPNFFEHKKMLCWAMIFSYTFCFIICIYFTVAYNSNVGWQSQLNDFFGGRLRLGHTSLIQNGVSIFGQNLELVGNGLDAYGNKSTNTYNYVDSYYVQILLRYGIVFSAIWIGFLTYVIYRYYKMNDYPMMACLTVIALHCILDDASLNICYNTFLFAGNLVIVNVGNNYQQIYKKSILAQKRRTQNVFR